ncbi:MAG: hypothetical protein ABII12_16205 [Planctomycetota bacterium]
MRARRIPTSAEGRGAGCYNTLGDLVKAKKLHRQEIKGQRWSLYTIA